MSVSHIPSDIKNRLWGLAAGRCQYEGCNHPLWIDGLTKAEFNTSYIAHIVADRPGGPRGDETRSEELKDKICNLMLMCDAHHRLIDRTDVDGHPESRLLAMKEAHEKRIELLTSIDEDRRSHVVLYGATVGDNAVHLDWQQAAAAMVPQRYPASRNPIRLGMINSTWTDRKQAFWEIEKEQLRAAFAQDVMSLRRGGELPHASVFAFAPQPLLVQLGMQLSDLFVCDVYQLQREPAGWKWNDEHVGENAFLLKEPVAGTMGTPVLVLGTTDPIVDDWIRAVVPDAMVWRVTIERPDNDFLKRRGQLAEFRALIRPLLHQIRNAGGHEVPIHVFLATSVAIAVELGRCYQPKAMPPLICYDLPDVATGYVQALTLGRGAE